MEVGQATLSGENKMTHMAKFFKHSLMRVMSALTCVVGLFCFAWSVVKLENIQMAVACASLVSVAFGCKWLQKRIEKNV